MLRKDADWFDLMRSAALVWRAQFGRGHQVGHKQLKAGLVRSSMKPDGTTLLDHGV
jgi:hypothetical protein